MDASGRVPPSRREDAALTPGLELGAILDAVSRTLFIGALLCALPMAAPAQTKGSHPPHGSAADWAARGR